MESPRLGLYPSLGPPDSPAPSLPPDVPPTASLLPSHIPHLLGDAPGDRRQAPLHGRQVGQVSRALPDPVIRRSGKNRDQDTGRVSSNDTCLDATASRMLEGPVPPSLVPVVRGLGHFPPADRQGGDTVARNRDRGQSSPRDHHKVSQRLSCIRDAEY